MAGFYVGTELLDAVATEDGFALVSEDFSAPAGDPIEVSLAAASWEFAGVTMIQVVGPAGPSLTVEGTISGDVWVPCEVRAMSTDLLVTAITAAGLYLLDTTGLMYARILGTAPAGTTIEQLSVIGGD